MKEVISILLQKAIKKEGIKLTNQEIESFVEIPKNVSMGDFAFPCFFLSSKLKLKPHEIALKLKQNMGDTKEFEDIQTSGPYVNFLLDKKLIAISLIKEVLSKKDKYGNSNLGKGKKTMVEFSQPNTHKAFHVGHIRGTSLGESISRISEFFGEKIIRANYSGDTGMHIAKWIWGYQKYHSKEKPTKDETWIASIYVDAIKKISENKKFKEEVSVINKKIEDKSDPEINKLWKQTRKLSVDSWKKIYKELNTHFDKHYFESEVEKRGIEISKELVKKNIAKIDEGATIMRLEEYGLSVWVLLREDGTVLYSGKDLALAEQKIKDYKLNKYLIITASEQDLHFRQLFKTMELMNFSKREKFSHISYDLVRLPHGKMSSRTGDNILYSDFKNELVEYTKKGIKQRSPKLSKLDLEKRALIISIAAMKYSMLSQQSNKVIIFDKQKSLNFEGNTGPYIQYSYARASSILRKSNKSKMNVKNLHPKEIELIKKLSQFKDVSLKAYETLNPALIAHYSYELAQIFNEFYHACPVIGSENEGFKLKLIEAFKQILKNSLNLLGIEVLEEM